MHLLRWYLLLWTLAGVYAPQALAQSASLSIEAETEELTPNQIFVVEIRADVENGDPEQLRLPDLSAFAVLGHEVSTPMQFSFRLGLRGAVRTIRSSVVHRFELRAPPTAGRYAIGPARLKLKSRLYQSNVINVTVAGVGSQPNSLPSAQDMQPPPLVDFGGAIDSQAFIRPVVDKLTPYVGEQVTVSFFLYLAGPLRAAPTVTQEPSTEGFWVQDVLAASRPPEPSVQVIHGQPYRAYLLRRWAAFPLRPGALEIGSMRATVPVGSIFDVFGGGRARDLERTSAPLTLHVKALPRPGQASTAPVHVGSLALNAKIARSPVATGDAVKLQLDASGSGNLLGLRFVLEPIDGLQILPPEVHDDVRTQDGRVSGTRSVQWLIVPERPGTYSIPAFVAHVWDADKNSYSVVKSEAVRLEAVGKAIAHTDAEVRSKEEAPRWGPIRQRSQLRRKRPPITASGWYLAGLVLPMAFACVAYGSQVFHRRTLTRPLPQQSEARGDLGRKVKHLERHISGISSEAFYQQIDQLLRTAVEAALGTGKGKLSHYELEMLLQTAGVPPTAVEQCLALLEQADQVRFASKSIPLELMKNHLAETKRVIEALKELRA